jgi:hypothetical protein
MRRLRDLQDSRGEISPVITCWRSSGLRCCTLFLCEFS